MHKIQKIHQNTWRNIPTGIPTTIKTLAHMSYNNKAYTIRSQTKDDTEGAFKVIKSEAIDK